MKQFLIYFLAFVSIFTFTSCGNQWPRATDIIDNYIDDEEDDDVDFVPAQPNIGGVWYRITTENKYSNNHSGDTFDDLITGEETYIFYGDGNYSFHAYGKTDSREVLKTIEGFSDLLTMIKPMEITCSFNVELTGTYTYDTEAEILLLTQTDLKIQSIEMSDNYGFLSLLKEQVENNIARKIYNLFPNGKTYDYEIPLCTEMQLWLQDDQEIAKYVRVADSDY